MSRRGTEGWSYGAAKNGSSRVRAYRARRGIYYIEWFEGGARIREVVRPSTREAAVWRAEEKGGELAGTVPAGAINLGRLLAYYHGAHTWAPRHAANQRKYRAFWLEALGAGLNVNGRTLTLAAVRKAVDDAGRERHWSGRTKQAYVKYIRAAIRWGYREARWLRANYLDRTEHARNRSQGAAYTFAELNAISALAPRVDPRFWAVWEIIRASGRRLSAVRRLRWDDLSPTDLERLAIRFPASGEPGGKRDRVFLTRQSERALKNLMEIPALAGSEWMFPSGQLRRRDGRDRPIGVSALSDMLRRAEGLAGVEHRKGRGFHGVKRRVVTQLMHEFNGDAEVVGQITGDIEPGVLLRTYTRHDDRVRAAAAEHLERLRSDS